MVQIKNDMILNNISIFFIMTPDKWSIQKIIFIVGTKTCCGYSSVATLDSGNENPEYMLDANLVMLNKLRCHTHF